MLEEIRTNATKQNADYEARLHEKAVAYHQAFVQSAAGKKVLDDWIRRYCMKPIQGDPSAFACGKVEGKRELVEEILNSVARIANEGKQ